MYICIYKYVTFIKNVINIILNNVSIYIFTHFTIADGNPLVIFLIMFS